MKSMTSRALRSREGALTRVSVTAMVLLVFFGCYTPYETALQRLEAQRRAGKISEAEYQRRRENLDESQPWGGIEGKHTHDERMPITLIPLK